MWINYRKICFLSFQTALESYLLAVKPSIKEQQLEKKRPENTALHIAILVEINELHCDSLLVNIQIQKKQQ